VIYEVFDLAVNDRADWLAHVMTDSSNGDWDEHVFRNGAPFMQEGLTALTSPSGAVVDEFLSMDLNNDGNAIFSHYLELSPGTHGYGVYLDSTLVLLDGDPANAAGFSAGTVYQSFGDVKMVDNDVLLRARVSDPAAVGVEDVLVLLELDASGALLSETLIAREYYVHGGGAPSNLLQGVWGWDQAAALSSNGEMMWVERQAGLTDVAYLDGVPIAQTGGASPIAGRSWGYIGHPELDLDERGNWVFKGLLDNSDTLNEVIVKNGVKFVQEGDVLPAIAPYRLEEETAMDPALGGGGADLTKAGDVLWWGHWDNPDSSRDTGLFLNERLIVEEGVTQIGGCVVTGIRSDPQRFFVSDSGIVIFIADRWPCASATVCLMSASSHDGNYCTSAPNSTGYPATMAAVGSTSISANDLALVGFPVPTTQSGVFYYGPAAAQVPFGNGTRCVSGPNLNRLDVEVSSSEGVIAHDLDLTDPPTAAGLITLGSTWYFQCWFRDPAGGGVGFDLSDGMALTFEQ